MSQTPEEKAATLAAMDAAADKAFDDLAATPPNNVLDVVNWLRNNYMAAGYKRLCQHLFREYTA